MRTSKNTKMSRVNRHYTLTTLCLVLLAVTLLSACGDFRDESTPQVPAPALEPKPDPKPQPHSETELQRNKRLCDVERKWALESGLIDLNQLRLYENRNFAPVFNTPGVRQSGVDGWIKCDRALEINGFIAHKEANAQPVLVAEAAQLSPDRETEKFRESPPQRTATHESERVPLSSTEPQTENHDQETNKMCEEERDYVLRAGLIDPNLYRMFQKRNFAPVYENPGERQSSIESWQPCLTALRINGFIWY